MTAIRICVIALIIGGSVVGIPCQAAPPATGGTVATPDPGAPIAIGFGVALPSTLPLEWGRSFSFLTVELLPDPNLTFLFTFGTYPAYFPGLHEASGSIIVKGWIGPAALYAGGGFSIRSRLIGDAWLWSPYMNVTAGMQLWVVDSLALSFQVRSLERIPVSWRLYPEVSLGLSLALGRARPIRPAADEAWYFWLLAGLGVLAIIAYYPRR